jgi:hypothetical protein
MLHIAQMTIYTQFRVWERLLVVPVLKSSFMNTTSVMFHFPRHERQVVGTIVLFLSATRIGLITQDSCVPLFPLEKNMWKGKFISQPVHELADYTYSVV